jgi:hypothetical protein
MILPFLTLFLTAIGTATSELCVMNSTTSSLRCCTIEDGQDRLDAPMMRYCASISCVPNSVRSTLLATSHVLQFDRALIGQGLFEEPAATPSFRLPRLSGTPAAKSLAEALIQCEQSTVRTACLYMNVTQFSATPEGACTACLDAANWNVVVGVPPISRARVLIKCFTLYRAGYVAPTTTTTTTTTRSSTVISSALSAASNTGSTDTVPLSDTAVLTKDNIGIIAGAAGGAAVLLLLIVVIVLIALRSRRARSSSSARSNDRAEANSAPALAMEPERASGNMSSARSSAGVSARTAPPAAPLSRTQYEDFDDMQDVKDKDPRTMANPAVRTAEQQRQIDSIMQRNHR